MQACNDAIVQSVLARIFPLIFAYSSESERAEWEEKERERRREEKMTGFDTGIWRGRWGEAERQQWNNQANFCLNRSVRAAGMEERTWGKTHIQEQLYNNTQSIRFPSWKRDASPSSSSPLPSSNLPAAIFRKSKKIRRERRRRFLHDRFSSYWLSNLKCN